MDIEEQYDKIYRYCYFKVHHQQLAEDITQETFLRYYKQELHLTKDKELRYLYTIAKHLCIDSFRQKPMEIAEDVVLEPSYDPTREWVDQLTLRAVIERLPDEEREMIFLRYVNELSMASISSIVGVSRFAVCRRITKALKWLKEELKREEFSE